MVGAIMVAHYTIHPVPILYHDMLRRSVYVPIILAAVWFGATGGVSVAVIAGLLYAPHLFLQLRLPRAAEIDSAVEMVLYVIVGGLTGLLAEREKWQRRQTEETLVRLQHTHEELQRQTERLAEVQDGLRKVERMSTVGELAADLAHEIRNPLAAVRGTAQILASEFPQGHKKREFSEILIAELDRLNGVLEGYLRAARTHSVQGGRSDAVAVLSTVVELTRQQAQRSTVRIQCHGPDRLPVAMNADQLTQVFMNLALNAIQAMPHGGVLEIDSGLTPGDADGSRWCDIAFADTGAGVPAEHREKIFETFFTTKPAGTGLGLGIARRLVTEHGGTLTLEAARGQGSVFRVRLPLVDA